MVDKLDFLHVLLIFSVSNLFYSSVVSLYKLIVLSAGINNFWVFLIFLISPDSHAWKLYFIFFKFDILDHVIKMIFTLIKLVILCWCFKSLEKRKLVLISFVDLLLFLNVFHLILLIKLFSLCIKFFWYAYLFHYCVYVEYTAK